MARRSDSRASSSRSAAGHSRSPRSGRAPKPQASRASRSPRGSGSSRFTATASSGRSTRRQDERPVAADSRRPAAESTGLRSARSKGTSRPAVASSRASRSAREGQRGGNSSRKGAFRQRSARSTSSSELVSTSVGELRREARREQAKKKSRRRLGIIIAAIGVVVAVLAGWAALYNSPAFKIENVVVNGVEHLTSDEMAQLANVPADTTLLRVDTATIEARVEQNAWVADAQVVAVFPDTLEINVTERPVFAIVEIPTGSSSVVKQWAIAEDHMWLMPIPDVGSEAAKTTSAKIYEDAESVLHVTDVPYGTKAEIGKYCSDANVNNALDILAGLTTNLSNRVAKVSAAGTAETTLVLDNGVEIAFGKAEDIRDKERVILQILEDNPDNVAYINVRIVDSPTWRAV